MSEFESTSQAPAGSEVVEMQEEVNTLRTLLSAAVVLMIVFTMSVNLYLLKEVSSAREKIDTSERIADDFNAPKAIDFWNKLVAYSREHPNFAPVMNKFSPALDQTLIGRPDVLKQ